MRLIDADALIQKRNHAKNYSPDMYVIGQGCVMDAPTISAVPVVRCGECKHYNPPYVARDSGICSFKSRDELINHNDYCSYGEKMEVKE